MRISKGLILGIVASLSAGAVAAAAELGLDAALNQENVDNSPVTIPNGRLGDQIAYATFERSNADEAWQRVGTFAFRADRVETVADTSTMPHDALVVLSPPEEYIYGGPAGQGGLAGMETAYDATVEYRKYVDLASRDIVSWGGQFQPHNRDLFVRERWANYTQLQPGPFSAWNLGPDAWAKLMPFPYQGRTYQLGDAADQDALDILLHDTLGWNARADVIVENLAFSGRVANRAMVDGHDAYGIHTNGCFDISLMPDGWALEPNRANFLHSPIELPSHVCYETMTWLAADFAYPLLYEERVTRNGTATHEWLETVGAISHGHTEIPWARNRAKVAYRDDNPDAERSPANQRHPADGSGLRLAYPLSTAMTDVNSNLLLQFAQWKASHAQSRLVGAKLEPTGAGETLRWSLVFAVPDGDAFVVTTERTSGSTVAAVHEEGSFSGPAFEPDAPKGGPITLAAADAIRREHSIQPDPLEDANFVLWGFLYRVGGVRCDALSRCAPTEGRIDGNPWYANLITIGHTDQVRQSGSFSAEYVTGDGMGVVGSYVSVKSNTGNLWVAWEADEKRGFAPMVVSDEAAPAVALDAMGMPGIRPPDIMRGALVSSSLLIVFLIAYFLPLLKFLGAQAFTLLPGYAKIQKSDVLHNKVRDTMVTAIRADPGVTAPKLQQLTGAGWSTVVYHLGVLERNKLVSSLIDGRHKRFFPVEAVNWSDRTRLAALKNARTKELYEAILGEPGVGFRELSHQVGISRPALYWHVERLTKAGLVGQDRDGSKIRFYANEAPNATPYDPNTATEVV